jgi:NAD-dependent deacetylase
MSEIEQLKQILKSAKRTVFFGGAGVSTESGIPDFRSTDGLYSMQYDYPPETILSHSFFTDQTSEFYRFYRNKMIVDAVQPNATHLWLAQHEVPVVTQNIDGLHSMAAAEVKGTSTVNYLSPMLDNIYELHGSIHRNYCTKCHQFYSLPDLVELLETSDIPYCKRTLEDSYQTDSQAAEKQFAPNCSGIVKPDVVLYEEGLDDEVITRSVELIKQADTLIIGGTSLTVYPAASLIYSFRGENLVLINRDATTADSGANLVIRQPLGQVFTQLTQ